MKILALDLGNKWTGTALSDALGMFSKPYKTIETRHLNAFLTELFEKEKIDTIVVGDPKTLKGTDSEQTKIVTKMKQDLESLFPNKSWVSWDERLTSKQASTMKKKKNEDKTLIHSRAAAIILESYLGHLQFKKMSE